MSNKKVTNTTPFYFPPSSPNEGITMKHKIRTHVNNVRIYTTTPVIRNRSTHDVNMDWDRYCLWN